MQTDLERSIEYVRSAGQSVGNHAAPIRYGFIGNEGTDSPARVPPLARLVRGGQSGDVRLKLELTALWLLSTQSPHQRKYLANVWATLIYLPAPTENGARRVKAALASLARDNLLRIETRPGTATLVTLLNERGEGSRYQHPSRTTRYVQLPATFWTNRWIEVLPASAIAIFLAILHELTSRCRVSVWVAPSIARGRYALSADTWSRGVAQLRDRRLITIDRLAVSQNPLEEPGRFRNAYRLKADESNTAEHHASWDTLQASIEATLATLPPGIVQGA
jgi:hypothetical protein